MDKHNGKTHKTCSVHGCEETHRSKGYCETHYGRWRRHGDPEKVLRQRSGTLYERVRYRTEIDANGCHNYTGTTTRNGYGNIGMDHKNYYPHRVTYEHVWGPIPPGYDVDHCCGNKKCTNPLHLQAVPHRENCKRKGTFHLELWEPPYQHNYTGSYATMSTDDWKQYKEPKNAPTPPPVPDL